MIVIFLIDDFVSFFTNPEMNAGYRIDSDFSKKKWYDFKHKIFF